jgi:hypothetical protein
VLELAYRIDGMFVPSIGIGLVLGILSRFVRTGRMQRISRTIASILFFVPQILILYLGTYSSDLRMYQQGILSLWGLGVGIATMVQLLSVRQLEKLGNHFILALGATAMMVLGIYCGRNTIGDYVLKHDNVMGTVDGVIENPPLPGSYQVIINRKAYNITFDLAKQLGSGDYVYAEVGIASNTVLSVRR